MTHPSPNPTLYPPVPVTPSVVVGPCLPVWLSYANQNQIHGWAEGGSALQVGSLLALTVQDLTPVLGKGPTHPSLEAALTQAVVVQLVSIEQSPKGDNGPEQPIRWVAQRLSGQATFAVRYATPLHPQYVLTLTQTKYPVLWPLYGQVSVDTGRLKGITLFQADTETLLRDGISNLIKALPPTASVLMLDGLQLQASLPTLVAMTWLVLGDTARLAIDRLSVPVFLRLVASMVPPVFADQAMMQMASCITVDRPLLGLSSLGKPASPFHPLLKRELSALYQDEVLAQTPDQVLRLDDWRAGLCKRLGLALHRWPERYTPWLLEALTLELAAGTPQSGHIMVVITVDGAQVSSAWIEACQRWAQASNLSVVLATVGINQEPWQDWAHSCIRKEQSGLLTLEGTISALASLRIEPTAEAIATLAQTDSLTSPAPLSSKDGSPDGSAIGKKPIVSASEEEAARMDFSGFILRQLGAYKLSPPAAPSLGYQATGSIAPLFPVLESPPPISPLQTTGTPPLRFSSFQVAFDPADLPPETDPDLPPLPPMVPIQDPSQTGLSLSSYQVDLEADTPEPDLIKLADNNPADVDFQTPIAPETPTNNATETLSVTLPSALVPSLDTLSDLERFAYTSLPMSPAEQELPLPPAPTLAEDWPLHPCLPFDMVDDVRQAMNRPPQEAGEGMSSFMTLQGPKYPALSPPALQVSMVEEMSAKPFSNDDVQDTIDPILLPPQDTAVSSSAEPIDEPLFEPEPKPQVITPLPPETVQDHPARLDAFVPEGAVSLPEPDWNLPPTYELLPDEATTRLPQTPEWLDFEIDWDSLDPASRVAPSSLVMGPPPFDAPAVLLPQPEDEPVQAPQSATRLPDELFPEFQTVLDTDFLMPEDQEADPTFSTRVDEPVPVNVPDQVSVQSVDPTPPTYSIEDTLTANLQPPAVVEVDWSESVIAPHSVEPEAPSLPQDLLTDLPTIDQSLTQLPDGFLPPAPAPSLTPAPPTLAPITTPTLGDVEPLSSTHEPDSHVATSGGGGTIQYDGKRVGHPTYGHGTVKKVLELDGRMILTIQFDGVGKRLLDPSLSPLEILDNSSGQL